MEYFDFTIKELDPDLRSEKCILDNFLCRQKIDLDKNIDYTCGVFDGDKIAATGSISGNTLRSIAVSCHYQGSGVINMLISHLVTKQYERGNRHLFIYTKPESAKSFTYFDFYEIERAASAVLMENKRNGLKEFCENLAKQKKDGKKVSGIVVNCNPFTKGHLYLIEKAAKESDVLHVFVVWEDRSAFPNEIRYGLVKKGTAHLKNVLVHKGENYIISSATFPSYFIKESTEIVKTHAELDLNIFSKHIAPALEINHRYVGVEPYCEVTNVYNETMKKILPEKGIRLVEVERRSSGNEVISASKVRTLLKEDNFAEIEKIVPATTLEYLKSEAAEPIITKLKNSKTRH